MLRGKNRGRVEAVLTTSSTRAEQKLLFVRFGTQMHAGAGNDTELLSRLHFPGREIVGCLLPHCGWLNRLALGDGSLRLARQGQRSARVPVHLRECVLVEGLLVVDSSLRLLLLHLT